MIKITKETVDAFGDLIVADKAGDPDDVVKEIIKENEYFLRESVRISRISQPGFMAGWMLAYNTIKRQIENDELNTEKG